MKNFLLIFSILSVISCGPGYHQGNINSYNSPPRPSKQNSQRPTGPGCYAKCIIPDQVSLRDFEVIEYTGTDYSSPNVVLEEIEIRAASASWVKKKSDKNCRSANPDDCLVWCLVNVPAETISLYVVRDTTDVKDYQTKTLQYKNIDSHGGYTEWKQVICDNKIDASFYQKLSSNLVLREYVSSVTDQVNPELKAAVVKFQKDNNLPVGQLDCQTLSTLGIEGYCDY